MKKFSVVTNKIATKFIASVFLFGLVFYIGAPASAGTPNGSTQTSAGGGIVVSPPYYGRVFDCTNEYPTPTDIQVTMRPGDQCLYNNINGVNYIITFKSVDFANNATYEISWGQNSVTADNMYGGYFTVNDAFTIHPSIVRPLKNGSRVLEIHRVIPTNQLQATENCNTLADPALQKWCVGFVQKEMQTVVPAMEAVSKVSLGRCFSTVNFDFDPPPGGLGTTSVSYKTVDIHINPKLAEIIAKNGEMEIHEMMHAQDYCLNVVNPDVHPFWQPRQEAIYRELGEVALADKYKTDFSDWIHKLDMDPDFYLSGKAFNGFYGELQYNWIGCTGVKDYLLGQDYLATGTTVDRFYTTFRSNQNNLIERTGGAHIKTLHALVLKFLGGGQTIKDQMNKYCVTWPAM